MSELLAPAGNYEALVAAISNGANAIYLGMNQFGARAYAKNFDFEELNQAIKYAHLREVKIYVTMNTIIFDSELTDAYLQIDKLYELNTDGIITQDLALIDYIINHCPLMECHTSTQLGIDDLEGVELMNDLGVKRVVLSREVDLSKIKYIKDKSSMQIEIFIHGALCVSYSGNCLMSGLIGYRSGNRGRCVGSCRKPYRLINKTTGASLGTSYLLSMKDLNTTAHIQDLLIADSLKIEGRMKEAIYVANIVNSYRQLIDNPKYSVDEANRNLAKTFNRTFTKGYLFGEDKKNITNTLKPNNFGYPIGKVTAYKKNKYQITLTDILNQGDQIRIDSSEDVNMPVLKIYDSEDNLVNSADKICFIELKEKLTIGDIVYKTKDTKFNASLEKLYPREFQRFPVNFYFSGEINEDLNVTISCQEIYVSFIYPFKLLKAINKPTDLTIFTNQLQRLSDTPYVLNQIELHLPQNSFIPVNKLNDLRREAILRLDEARLAFPPRIKPFPKVYKPIVFEPSPPQISVFCNTKEQYEAAIEMGIDIIYYKDNIKRRNHVTYTKVDTTVLVGGYGGIKAYQGQDIVSDFSLNVVNAKSTYLLHSLGVNRVTISHEINKKEIEDLINSYYMDNNGYPNLEMIVYGRADLLFTEYCPLKKMNLCGECRNNQFVIEDEYGQFPILNHADCTTTILNGKILNLIDDFNSIKNINVFRLQFTLESKSETLAVINMFKNKLHNSTKTHFFNDKTDTRGHFNKEIL